MSDPTPSAPLWIDLLGWTGAVCLLAAFFLDTLGFVASDAPAYLAGNLLGAIGVGAHAASCRSHPAVIVNLLWAVVAIIGLVRAATT